MLKCPDLYSWPDETAVSCALFEKNNIDIVRLQICLVSLRPLERLEPFISKYPNILQQIKEILFLPRSIPDRVVNGGRVSSIQYVNVIYEYDNIFIGALLDKELLNSKNNITILLFFSRCLDFLFSDMLVSNCVCLTIERVYGVTSAACAPSIYYNFCTSTNSC